MNERLAFLINTKYCNECKTCEIACKMERKLQPNFKWRKVRSVIKFDENATDRMGGNDLNKKVYVAMSCNHCADPQCVAACPVYAYQKMPNGAVVQDNSRCIGCTKCVSACPYSAPVYDKAANKSSKCDMCYARLEKGMKPACVQSCPNNSLKLGHYEALVASYGESQDLGTIDSSVVPSGTKTNPSIVIVK